MGWTDRQCRDRWRRGAPSGEAGTETMAARAGSILGLQTVSASLGDCYWGLLSSGDIDSSNVRIIPSPVSAESNLHARSPVIGPHGNRMGLVGHRAMTADVPHLQETWWPSHTVTSAGASFWTGHAPPRLCVHLIGLAFSRTRPMVGSQPVFVEWN